VKAEIYSAAKYILQGQTAFVPGDESGSNLLTALSLSKRRSPHRAPRLNTLRGTTLFGGGLRRAVGLDVKVPPTATSPCGSGTALVYI